MVDETTDISNKEQVVFCFRWVDQFLNTHEEFLGHYCTGSTEASVIFSVIKDVMMRMNVSFMKIRGQCYDGATSKSGSRSGVATRIVREEPKAIYTHCYGHSLSLACSDTIKNCTLMRNALVKKSPRRDSTLESLDSDGPGYAFYVRLDGLCVLMHYRVY